MSCRLFTLPAELRLQIYDELFQPGIVYKWIKVSHGEVDDSPSSPFQVSPEALLLTCRLIHQELDAHLRSKIQSYIHFGSHHWDTAHQPHPSSLSEQRDALVRLRNVVFMVHLWNEPPCHRIAHDIAETITCVDAGKHFRRLLVSLAVDGDVKQALFDGAMRAIGRLRVGGSLVTSILARWPDPDMTNRLDLTPYLLAVTEAGG